MGFKDGCFEVLVWHFQEESILRHCFFEDSFEGMV